MKKYYVTFAFFMVCLIGLPHRVESHALDPESIDRFANMTLSKTHLLILYEVILGMKPTERAAKQLDADNDGEITDEERDAFVEQRAKKYAENQVIQLGEHSLEPRFKVGDAYSFIGHNSINVIKIDLGYLCTVPDTIPREEPLSFVYEDKNFPRVGWKQIKFQARSDITYEGFIPYEDYEAFDYEKMIGLDYPMTDRIELTVTFPKSGTAQTNRSTNAVEIQLPERLVEPDDGNWLEGVIIGAVLIFIVVFAAAVVIRIRA